MTPSGARHDEAKQLLQERFGLSSYEARVYVALLQAQMKPKELASKARVPLPRVYDILDRLEQKGFVYPAGERYSAIAPHIALKTRLTQFEAEFRDGMKRNEDAKRRIESLIRTVAKPGEQKSEVVLLRGINTIAGKLLEALQNAKSLYVTAKKGLEAKEFFKQFAGNLDLGSTRVRILVPNDAELTAADLRLARKLGLEIRRSSAIMFDMVVVDKREVMIGVPDPLSEELFHSVAVWVRSESFAKSVGEALAEIWIKAS